METHKRSKDNNSNKYSQSSVDAGVFNNLEKITSDLQGGDAHNDNRSKNFKPLIEFCQRGFLNQVVQTWSYYAQVNNHAMVAKSTMVMVNTLRLLGKNESKTVVEYGSVLIKLILTEYVKVLYRGLNNVRGQVTNPTLYLMKEMILFNESQHIEEFISFFDFSLPSLPKIMTPSKSELEKKNDNDKKSAVNAKDTKKHKPLRLSMIEFWLTLIEKTPSILRKDLLVDNFKIMSAWFKYMDKVDSHNIMQRTITVFIECILNEKLFKKMTKTKVLNEFAVAKIHHFYYSNNKELISKVNDFFIAYGVTPQSNVAFSDNCVWFGESPISSSHTSVPIMINQREFKIYNKLLFNVLKLFKPWEDDLQSATVIKFLQATPELVAPYCANITSLGSHDPKMTSYWFGMTLLLGRIINLPIPSFMENIDTDLIPSTSLVIENIIPSSLTKTALTKALQHNVSVIKQLGCQLIVFTFQKLEKVLELYERKGWNSSKAALNTLFFNNIPDLPVIVTTLTQLYNKNRDNSIISLSLSVILRHYSNCFPNFFSVSLPTSNIYVDIMRKDSFNGMELAILDNFLQFQEYNSTQTKWWNASNNDNSLFTSLLKFASSVNATNASTLKIGNLLNNLLNGSVIFKNELLIPSITCLINSLQVITRHLAQDNNTANINIVWKLLDQCIARVVKTPYKYVALAEQFDNISPFLMTIAEQWKYVSKDDHADFDLLSKWVCILFRTSIMTGESLDGLAKLAQEYLEGISEKYLNVYLNFQNNAIKQLSKPEYLLSDCIDSSFFQYINLLDYRKMKTITRIPTNDFDAVAILSKLQSLCDDADIFYNTDFTTTVVPVLEEFAKYIFTNHSFKTKIDKICVPFFEKIIVSENTTVDNNSQKYVFISQQLLYIVKEINGGQDTVLEEFLNNWLLKICKSQNKINDSINNLIALASSYLSISHIQAMISIDFQFTVETIFISLTRIFENSESHIPYSLVEKYLTSGKDIVEVITSFIKSNRVTDINTFNLISICLKDTGYSSLLTALIESNDVDIISISALLEKIENNSIKLSLACLLNSYKTENSIIKQFIEDTVNTSYNEFKTLKGKDFNNCILLFSNNQDCLSIPQRATILEFITTEYDHKYSDVIIDFVKENATFEETFIVRWFNKMTFYLTRIFSDRQNLSESHLSALSSFKKLIEKVDIWKKVNKKIINSQLEAILKGGWINNTDVLEYVIVLTFNSSKNDIENERIVQFIINNENSALSQNNDDQRHVKFLITEILYILFNVNPLPCCNQLIQSKLLSFYSGTISSSDRLLLNMLETIESKLSASWTNLIYTWDLLDSNEDDLELIGETKLFTQEREGLVLTLRKDHIENSISNYVVERPQLPEINKKSTRDAYRKFYLESERFQGNGTIYDPYFLLLLSIHNKELVKVSSSNEESDVKYTFNVKNFISSKLLNFVVCALADGNPSVRDISNTLIYQMVQSLEDEASNFKDSNIYSVLLKKIVFTINKQKEEAGGDQQENPSHNVVPMVWFFISAVCDLLTQPSSPLYEKAFRWILSGPLVRSHDIPMLYELVSPKHSDINNDNYYRQLSWVLQGFETFIKTTSDIMILRNRGIIEWLSNLNNNPYLNARLISMINGIFFRIQRIEQGGSMLITRFAGISNLEVNKMAIDKSLAHINTLLEKNSKNNKTMRTKLVLEEQSVNAKELMLSYSKIVHSEKRLREWTEDEAENTVKRVCT